MYWFKSHATAKQLANLQNAPTTWPEECRCAGFQLKLPGHGAAAFCSLDKTESCGHLVPSPRLLGEACSNSQLFLSHPRTVPGTEGICKNAMQGRSARGDSSMF